MEICSQCEIKPAIYSVGGHLLCLNCYSILQQAQAAEQQARNDRLNQISAQKNYLTEMMAWHIGLRATPPQHQIPQPIHTHINNPIFNNMNISNSQIGMLNTGSISNVQNIDVNVSTLVQSGQREIAEALTQLTEAVVSNQEIDDIQRTELIDQLETISNQAALPADNRKAGLIKPILTGLTTGISAVGTLSKVWSMVGDTVCNYFGYENPLKSE